MLKIFARVLPWCMIVFGVLSVSAGANAFSGTDASSDTSATSTAGNRNEPGLTKAEGSVACLLGLGLLYGGAKWRRAQHRARLAREISNAVMKGARDGFDEGIGAAVTEGVDCAFARLAAEARQPHQQQQAGQ